MQTHNVRPKTPQDLLEFFQSTFTLITSFDKSLIVNPIIYFRIHFKHFQPKKKEKDLRFQQQTDSNFGKQ